jgi:hypothetical protein
LTVAVIFPKHRHHIRHRLLVDFSWGVSVSGSKNFERDAFYAWLISPEVALAEIARERGGI